MSRTCNTEERSKAQDYLGGLGIEIYERESILPPLPPLLRVGGFCCSIPNLQRTNTLWPAKPAGSLFLLTRCSQSSLTSHREVLHEKADCTADGGSANRVDRAGLRSQ